MHLLSCSYATREENIERGEELQRKIHFVTTTKKTTKDPENFFFLLGSEILTQKTYSHQNTFFGGIFFFPQTDHVSSIFMSPLKKTGMSLVKRLSHSGNRLQLGKSSGQHPTPPPKALHFPRQACSKQKSLLSSACSSSALNPTCDLEPGLFCQQSRLSITQTQGCDSV